MESLKKLQNMIEAEEKIKDGHKLELKQSQEEQQWLKRELDQVSLVVTE